MNDLKAKISREAKALQNPGPKKRPKAPKFKPRHLSGLLVLQGPDFVNQAFEVLLGRKPQPKERDHYLQALLQGKMNRIDVLGRLRRSPEGRKKNTRLSGLYVLHGLQALSRRMSKRLPPVARLLHRLAALGTALIRSLAPDQAEFVQDQDRNNLESRITMLEKRQKEAEQEFQKFQPWCKQRIKSLELDWSRRLEACKMQHLGPNTQGDAVKGPTEQSALSAQDIRQESDLPWSIYAGFEDLFRGPGFEVEQGLQVLAPLVCSPDLPLPTQGFPYQALDLGCGRGEWLHVLHERGMNPMGVDLNPEFVSRCRIKGLNARQGEAMAYLASLPDASVPVVTALHLIEHLPPGQRFQLVQECFRILAPGGLALFETPNPRNILVGAGDFYRDPGHITPVFPDTLAFLGQMAGFEESTAFFFNQERTAFYPIHKQKFDSLQDYVQVSRDFFWTGRKAA